MTVMTWYVTRTIRDQYETYERHRLRYCLLYLVLPVFLAVCGHNNPYLNARNINYIYITVFVISALMFWCSLQIFDEASYHNKTRSKTDPRVHEMKALSKLLDFLMRNLFFSFTVGFTLSLGYLIVKIVGSYNPYIQGITTEFLTIFVVSLLPIPKKLLVLSAWETNDLQNPQKK